MAKLSAWSVVWAAFAFVASAAPNQYANYNYEQLPKKTLSADIVPSTDSSAGFDCTGKEDAAHGEGCSSNYWLCWKGVATSQVCPNDMMFNTENGQCDIYDNVFACSGVRATTALLLDSSPMPHVDFDCSHLEDGDYSFSDSSCQANYVSCVAGAAWERTCPEGLSFDLENRLCMLIEHIVACGGSPPTEAPVLVITFECPAPTGTFAVVSQLCSATYYTCADNVASIAVCADPMIWDDSNKQCSLPKDIPDCSFECTGKADAAYSEGCSQNYWWCWQEKASKLACPEGMVFDGERVLCDFKANVVECGGVLPTTTVIASDNATPMPVDFDCSSVEDGQHAFKNGEVCQPKFVSCVGGVAWEMSCPDGLLFDPDLLLCERIDAIVACGGTAAPVTTTISYQTTLAAEPTTLKKASYGSYQTPVAKPVKLVQKKILKPKPAHKAIKTTLAAEETTVLPLNNYYQTEATTLAAEIIPRRSYGDNQKVVEPTIRNRHHHQRHRFEELKKTTPLAEDTTTLAYGYELGSAPEVLSVYGSYETPAAEPTTRRHVKTTILAQPTTRAYGYQTTTPAAEPMTRKAFASYQTPAAEPTTRRHMKTTRLAELTTRGYGYQTTTPAAEPTTRRRILTTPSYGSYETPAAEPTTRLRIKTTLAPEKSYGSYETPAAEPTTRRHIKTTLAPKKSYGSYETPAAEPTTRRHIQTT
jgi:hypothetical protein